MQGWVSVHWAAVVQGAHWGKGVWTHVPKAQESAVHGSPSSQFLGGKVQVPDAHTLSVHGS